MDSTLKEINISRSIRKFCIDALGTTQNLFFDYQYGTPIDSNGNKLTNWIIILLEGRRLDTLAEIELDFYIFTTNDREGDTSSSILDSIHEIFIDETRPDGNTVISLYNTDSSPWEKVGGLVPTQIIDSPTDPLQDKMKMRSVKVTLRWGAKI